MLRESFGEDRFVSCGTPHPTLPLRGGGIAISCGLPSPLEGEGRVGGVRGRNAVGGKWR
jgi:hypothetical protein